MDKNNDQAACNGEQHEDPVDNMDEEAAAKEKLTSDPNKVKFTSVNLDGYNDGKNGEAKVDIYVAQTTVGMGKEELMKYANEPFWIRLRMFLFVFFWVAWIAMLVGAVVIILVAPRCPPQPTVEWYQKTPLYQVNVKNFKDSNGDGIGDFQGLISNLDYFKTQNIGALMLSAFYESSDDNSIIDHKNVGSKVGTITDFEELLAEMNEKDIKMVIDFNPNHSSDQHQWFKDSVEKKMPFDDFYIWSDSKNNWINVDGEPAWVWNNERKQFYLATFGKHKPDLNLRNEKVKEELKDILRFWLEKGVHGFKVVAASHLVEDESFREEPLGTKEALSTPAYKDVDHMYTLNQRENFELFAEWREILLSNFTESPGLHKVLIAEVTGSVYNTTSYYKNGTQTLADLAFNTQMTEIGTSSTGIDLKEKLESWQKSSDVWPTFLLGSEKTERLAKRVGDDLVDAMHMVAVIAKGTPITYYGDELGMTSLQSVMLWNNETNAGFSNGSNPVTVEPNYPTMNVQSQRLDKQSHLNIFKSLLALRGQPALSFGLQEYPICDEEVFTMIRVRKGSPGYLVVINFSTNSTVINFTGESEYLPESARVEIKSGNVKSGPLTEGDHPKVFLNSIPLEPKQAVVFSFVPQFKG
jgi:neutral and basic amino acid transporter 1